MYLYHPSRGRGPVSCKRQVSFSSGVTLYRSIELSDMRLNDAGMWIYNLQRYSGTIAGADPSLPPQDIPSRNKATYKHACTLLLSTTYSRCLTDHANNTHENIHPCPVHGSPGVAKECPRSPIVRPIRRAYRRINRHHHHHHLSLRPLLPVYLSPVISRTPSFLPENNTRISGARLLLLLLLRWDIIIRIHIRYYTNIHLADGGRIPRSSTLCAVVVVVVVVYIIYARALLIDDPTAATAAVVVAATPGPGLDRIPSHVSVHVCACVCVCVRVYVYVCVCACMYTRVI